MICVSRSKTIFAGERTGFTANVEGGVARILRIAAGPGEVTSPEVSAPMEKAPRSAHALREARNVAVFIGGHRGGRKESSETIVCISSRATFGGADTSMFDASRPESTKACRKFALAAPGREVKG